jgi:hypothetical protein
VDQRDREARLQALAARIDDGEPIDWADEERLAGAEGRDVVRALRIVAEIARQARRGTETIESTAVTEPTPLSPVPPAADEPVSDRYRSHTPSEPAEIRRKLFFGVALLLAMASVYAGLLGWGRVLQYGLAGVAVLTVLVAMVSGATGPPGPPSPPGDPTSTPGPGATPGPTA